jgi:hypothetical protein
MKFFIALTILAVQGCLAIDENFVVDHRDVRMNEMAQNIKTMSGALMGIAEYVIHIDEVVRHVQKGVGQVQRSVDGARLFRSERAEGPEKVSLTPQEAVLIANMDKAVRNEMLAQKVEKLLAVQNNSAIEEAKDEMSKRIESNFLRMLAAILVAGPSRTQMRTDEIFKLMRTVLNGELDFRPVVEKLPFILRESETNQFISLLRSLKEVERVPSATTNWRQFGGLENFDKVLDAFGKFDVQQVSGFLKEIPELFEGVEAVVDGVDSYFSI